MNGARSPGNRIVEGAPSGGAASDAPADAIVRVAAAVVERADGAVLLAQRPPGKAYAGYWEFPGGKLEAGETPAHALARELREELGLIVRNASPWLVQEFVYPHAHVELNFFRVRGWDGEPHGHDGQAFAWQDPLAIEVAPLLPANTRVLAALRLPAVYAITCAGDIGEAAFLARAEQALANGVRLIQVREKGWSEPRRDAFAVRINALAERAGARVLLNADAESARRAGCAGVHWTSAALNSAIARPRDLLVAASCHTKQELARAAALGVDFAVAGPIFATPTHADAVPLGWQAFADLIAGTRVPVYALGGLHPEDLATARAHGAHGIAMRRFAWPTC